MADMTGFLDYRAANRDKSDQDIWNSYSAANPGQIMTDPTTGGPPPGYGGTRLNPMPPSAGSSFDSLPAWNQKRVNDIVSGFQNGWGDLFNQMKGGFTSDDWTSFLENPSGFMIGRGAPLNAPPPPPPAPPPPVSTKVSTAGTNQNTKQGFGTPPPPVNNTFPEVQARVNQPTLDPNLNQQYKDTVANIPPIGGGQPTGNPLGSPGIANATNPGLSPTQVKPFSGGPGSFQFGPTPPGSQPPGQQPTVPFQDPRNQPPINGGPSYDPGLGGNTGYGSTGQPGQGNVPEGAFNYGGVFVPPGTDNEYFGNQYGQNPNPNLGGVSDVQGQNGNTWSPVAAGKLAVQSDGSANQATNDANGYPQTGGFARNQLLDRLFQNADNWSPEQINEVVQSIQGLSTLPMSDYFSQQYPQAVSATQGLYNMAQQPLTQEYTLPGAGTAQDFGAGTVYEEGQPAAQQNNALLKAAQDLGIPLENLQELASTAAGNLPSSFDELKGTLAADTEEDYRRREEEMRNYYAANNSLGSSFAQDKLGDLTSQKSRDLAYQNLLEQTMLGGEQRANITTIQGLLESLFGQQTEGTKLGMDQIGTIGDIIGQGEGMDLNRRQVEGQRQGAQASEDQRLYQNLLQNLLGSENIRNTRLSSAQQPLGMLVSALSGVNVAPSALPGLQMPRQGPTTSELLGGLAGGLLPSFSFGS